MPSFGIIAEGVTDQVVIEAIVAGFFGDDDPDVRRVRPPPSETGRGPAVGDGGWGMVLKEFETGRFAEALDSGFFTHLIVQIDTDVSEQKGPRHNAGFTAFVAALNERFPEHDAPLP